MRSASACTASSPVATWRVPPSIVTVLSEWSASSAASIEIVPPLTTVLDPDFRAFAEASAATFVL